MDLPRAAPAGYPAPLPRPAGRQNILNTRTPGKQIMGRVQHVGSYYAASSQRAPERPALADGIDCDGCGVGAGIAGCSTALHLALAGLRVVLLEEQRVGWGAWGRSTPDSSSPTTRPSGTRTGCSIISGARPSTGCCSADGRTTPGSAPSM